MCLWRWQSGHGRADVCAVKLRGYLHRQGWTALSCPVHSRTKHTEVCGQCFCGMQLALKLAQKSAFQVLSGMKSEPSKHVNVLRLVHVRSFSLCSCHTDSYSKHTLCDLAEWIASALWLNVAMTNSWCLIGMPDRSAKAHSASAQTRYGVDLAAADCVYICQSLWLQVQPYLGRHSQLVRLRQPQCL